MTHDLLHRFVFDSAPARGAQVSLQHTWQDVLSRHNYPAAIRQPLGELLAASALLGSILKFSGSLVLQLQGRGALKLLVVEWNADRTLRATAKWDDTIATDASLTELLGHGQFVIILDPKTGAPPYQGIVPLEGHSVAQMLEHYMARSEQLQTRLWLACNDQLAVGLLLQRLPDGHGDADGWTRLEALGHTLTAAELLSTDAEVLRHRLFHEESVQAFEPEPQGFSCSCSRERVADMLKMVGLAELSGVLAEQGSVDVHCEYCNQRYVFEDADIADIFNA